MKGVLFPLLAVSIACAQAEPPVTNQPPPRTETASGIWPSPRLINRILVRWSEELADQYDLDDVQRKTLRAAVTKRWSGFLERHRSDLEPLFDDFIDMRLGIEPPAKQRVQEWAGRAIPVLDAVHAQLGEGADELRDILTPAQRVKLEVNLLQFEAGVRLAKGKLRTYQSGDFERVDFWKPPGARSRREADDPPVRGGGSASASVQSTTAQPQDQIELELHAWDKYVTDFVIRFDLDKGQQTSALSFLEELKRRAANHGALYRDEITRLERRIAQRNVSPDELAALKRNLIRLYGPIDDMFQELKRRLDSIPTTEQRAAERKARERDKGRASAPRLEPSEQTGKPSKNEPTPRP